MTKLEKQILAAMSELLEEASVPEIQDTETEIIVERVDHAQKKRDTQTIRESRRLFRRWRKQAGF